MKTETVEHLIVRLTTERDKALESVEALKRAKWHFLYSKLFKMYQDLDQKYHVSQGELASYIIRLQKSQCDVAEWKRECQDLRKQGNKNEST